ARPGQCGNAITSDVEDRDAYAGQAGARFKILLDAEDLTSHQICRGDALRKVNVNRRSNRGAGGIQELVAYELNIHIRIVDPGLGLVTIACSFKRDLQPAP